MPLCHSQSWRSDAHGEGKGYLNGAMKCGFDPGAAQEVIWVGVPAALALRSREHAERRHAVDGGSADRVSWLRGEGVRRGAYPERVRLGSASGPRFDVIKTSYLREAITTGCRACRDARSTNARGRSLPGPWPNEALAQFSQTFVVDGGDCCRKGSEWIPLYRPQ